MGRGHQVMIGDRLQNAYGIVMWLSCYIHTNGSTHLAMPQVFTIVIVDGKPTLPVGDASSHIELRPREDG